MTTGQALFFLRQRSVAFECMYQSARNALLPLLRTTFGHARFTEYADPAVCADYAIDVYRKYADMIERVSGFDLAHAVVLEVAPGQTMASTVCFLARGASRVIGIDKYDRVPLESSYEHEIYRRLFEKLGCPDLAAVAFREFAPAGLRNSEAVEFVTRCAVEQIGERLEPISVDLVCSNLVMNHVRDLDRAYRAAFRVLKPGGIFIHNIHFWHHYAFEWKGLFYYLSIPEPIWQLMTSRLYAVNRKSAGDHRRFAESAGFTNVFIRVDESNRHPREDAERYRAGHPRETRSADDLTARYFTICGQKPR
jgi:SAM-dependent methyltransferase